LTRAMYGSIISIKFYVLIYFFLRNVLIYFYLSTIKVVKKLYWSSNNKDNSIDNKDMNILYNLSILYKFESFFQRYIW